MKNYLNNVAPFIYNYKWILPNFVKVWHQPLGILTQKFELPLIGVYLLSRSVHHSHQIQKAQRCLLQYK